MGLQSSTSLTNETDEIDQSTGDEPSDSEGTASLETSNTVILPLSVLLDSLEKILQDCNYSVQLVWGSERC